MFIRKKAKAEKRKNGVICIRKMLKTLRSMAKGSN
jgi:hypothetical protein